MPAQRRQSNVEPSTVDTQKYLDSEYPKTVVPQHIQDEKQGIAEDAAKLEELLSTAYTGQCKGGPMDGMMGVSRNPKGFLLVDIPNQMVWIYDRVLDSENDRELFVCRPRDHWDSQRGVKAAEETNYDVRAFDAEVMLGPRGYDGEPHSG